MPDRNDVRARLTALERGMTKTEESRLSALRERLTALERKRVLRDPMAFIADKRLLLDYTQKNLAALAQQQMAQRTQQFTALAAKLDALSPLKVLGRGYAIASSESGELIKSVGDVNEGDKLSLSVSDGLIKCTVDESEAKSHG